MVLIPAGEFQMGTDSEAIPGLVQWLKGLHPNLRLINARWFEDETPQHTVYLGAFYMDKHEVTNAQYRKFVQATGHEEPEGIGLTGISGHDLTGTPGFKPWSDKNYNGDQQPVVCVSYEDAKAYAEWAGKRLPTEAEWEKAARGGLVGKRFLYGDDWPPPPKAGNFADGAFKRAFPVASVFISGYDDGYAYTAPVGSYNPNRYGLYDMAGNVWEWCMDWYDGNYYKSSPEQNPKGPASGDYRLLGNYRVLRGGSWLDDNANNLRAAARGNSIPTGSNSRVGFRCGASLSD